MGDAQAPVDVSNNHSGAGDVVILPGLIGAAGKDVPLPWKVRCGILAEGLGSAQEWIGRHERRERIRDWIRPDDALLRLQGIGKSSQISAGETQPIQSPPSAGRFVFRRI